MESQIQRKQIAVGQESGYENKNPNHYLSNEKEKYWSGSSEYGESLYQFIQTTK